MLRRPPGRSAITPWRAHPLVRLWASGLAAAALAGATPAGAAEASPTPASYARPLSLPHEGPGLFPELAPLARAEALMRIMWSREIRWGFSRSNAFRTTHRPIPRLLAAWSGEWDEVICGDLAGLWMDLAIGSGLTVRALRVAAADGNSHSLAELWTGDRWVLADATFGEVDGHAVGLRAPLRPPEYEGLFHTIERGTIEGPVSEAATSAPGVTSAPALVPRRASPRRDDG